LVNQSYPTCFVFISQFMASPGIGWVKIAAKARVRGQQQKVTRKKKREAKRYDDGDKSMVGKTHSLDGFFGFAKHAEAKQARGAMGNRMFVTTQTSLSGRTSLKPKRHVMPGEQRGEGVVKAHLPRGTRRTRKSWMHWSGAKAETIHGECPGPVRACVIWGGEGIKFLNAGCDGF
jgi:hypothetical protein